MNQFAGEDLSTFHEHTDKGICTGLGTTSLEDDQQGVIHDSVVPLTVDGSDDGWGNMRLYGHDPSKSVLTVLNITGLSV